MPRARNTFGLRQASHGCPTLLSPTYIILLWNYLKATLQILISILMTEPSQDPLNKDLEVKHWQSGVYKDLQHYEIHQ